MQLYKILILSFTLLVTASCTSQDNYPAPSLTLEGGIYDLLTRGHEKELLIPAESPNEARIRIYEKNSTQAETIWCKGDGSFINTKLFSGEYKLIPDGPFIVNQTDIVNVSIPTREKIKFYLEPYLRIKLKGSLNKEAKEAKFTFNISKSDAWNGILNQYIVLYSTTEHVSINSHIKSISKIITVDIESEFLDKDLEATITDIDLTKPKFIRVGAKTEGTDYYNYSDVIELK